MWIETGHLGRFAAYHSGSPVSDDGCGLKLVQITLFVYDTLGSPVSDDGCGLKQLFHIQPAGGVEAHPSAMTGVD